MPTKAKIPVSFSITQSNPWEDRLEAHLKSEAHMAAYQNARRVASIARRKVPQPPGVSKSGYVRTGKLKRSIERVKVSPGHHRIEVTAENSSGDEYGRYVEYGTRYMRAQPFLGPAVRAVRPMFRRDVRRILKGYKP